MVKVGNALLQFQDHWTSSIDKGDVVFLGDPVGLRRLAMSADQDSSVVQLTELFIADNPESEAGEPFHLLVVMHNIAQAIEGIVLRQVLLGNMEYGMTQYH